MADIGPGVKAWLAQLERNRQNDQFNKNLNVQNTQLNQSQQRIDLEKIAQDRAATNQQADNARADAAQKYMQQQTGIAGVASGAYRPAEAGGPVQIPGMVGTVDSPADPTQVDFGGIKLAPISPEAQATRKQGIENSSAASAFQNHAKQVTDYVKSNAVANHWDQKTQDELTQKGIFNITPAKDDNVQQTLAEGIRGMVTAKQNGKGPGSMEFDLSKMQTDLALNAYTRMNAARVSPTAAATLSAKQQADVLRRQATQNVQSDLGATAKTTDEGTVEQKIRVEIRRLGSLPGTTYSGDAIQEAIGDEAHSQPPLDPGKLILKQMQEKLKAKQDADAAALANATKKK